MFQQITKGIKISVKTKYNGIIARGRYNYHAFSYFVSIENRSKETVQLLERYWTILDTLNNVEFVEGEGVVGQTPIILPNDVYNYKSNCFLHAPLGAMLGNYKMVNVGTTEEFLVTIPTFQLNSTSALN